MAFEMNLSKRICSVNFFIILFHIAFIVLMGIFGRYSMAKREEESPYIYSMFMDVHSMMFIGFGFLMTFLKRYGFGSVGFNFIIAAYVLEWALIVKGYFSHEFHETGYFTINIKQLLVADFCSAAVLISFGAVIGKASLSQLLCMATIEVAVQATNEYIGVDLLKAYDVGESIYVHVFGAYFGLAVAKVLNHKKVENEKESSTYNSDLFSLIGTVFLWLYWPSFNSATAVEEGQTRAIVNTYLSIVSSCITTFAISLIINKGKFNMVHVQNATLAGGVAIGTIADMNVMPFSAMVIGSFAGIVSTLGFQYLTPMLKKIYLHDTCGVNNLHGMPGLIAGITGGIAAAVASRENYGGDRLYTFYPARAPLAGTPEFLALNGTVPAGDGRNAITQGGYQIAGLALTLGMAIVSGVITGFILRLPIFEQVDEKHYFDDEPFWHTPEDFALEFSSAQVNEETERPLVNA